jgi:hypothetical protein
MFDDDGTLRAVAWSEVLPWLRIFRCFRLAIRFRLLLLSAIAVLLTASGWALLVVVFSGDPAIAEQFGGSPESHRPAFSDLVRSATTDLVPDRPKLPQFDFGLVAKNLRLGLAEDEPGPLLERSPDPYWGTFVSLSRPFRDIFSSEITATKLALLLLCGVWTLAVWAFFGGAVTRVAALELARKERIGWAAMLAHARSRWRSCFAAPFILLVIVLAFAAGMGLVGICLRSEAGLTIVGVFFWPLMLLGGLAMAYVLLWLAFGWPLMWPAISAERGQDSFDALSRSNQFPFQCPLPYLFYVLVAVFVGWLGWLVVSNFAAAVIALTNWAADWGADASRWVAGSEAGASRQLGELLSGRAPVGAFGSLGAGLILFWCGCVKIMAVGYLYSYFWTASTCIYLLLRRDADGTEFDEVFVEEDDEPATGLPPFTTDEKGAPVVADEGPTPPEQAEPTSPGSDPSPKADGPPNEP